jgi:pilus assembly protein Flp/PilA
MRVIARLARLPSQRRGRAAIRLASRALRNDRGGEVVEYALVMGLMVVSAIAVITCIGAKVLHRWQSLDSSM